MLNNQLKFAGIELIMHIAHLHQTVNFTIYVYVNFICFNLQAMK